MSNSDDIINSVLQALDAGCAVFPLREGGKTPIYPGGCRDTTRSRAAAINHWKQHPTHNYGIATGRASGFFVLDIDGLKGSASLRALCARYGPLPPTVTVMTANGRHVYFKTGDALIGNSAGKLGPGLDVRGDGGYVVGAGSVHPNGQLYRYAEGHDPKSMPIATAPHWLIELVKKAPYQTSPTPAKSAVKSARSRAYGKAALDRENQRLASAPLHQRNSTLNHCAFRLGQLIGAGDLYEPEVIPRLTQTALQIGLTAGEVDRTIRSGISSGKQSPRRMVAKGAQSLSSQTSTPADDTVAADLAKLECTDVDNAKRFVKRFGRRFAHCPARGWLYFDSRRWERDTARKRVLAAIRTAARIQDEVGHLSDKTERQRRDAHAKHSHSKAALDRMLDLAAPMMNVADEQLDADPWLLNVLNGTVDLRTGRLHRHNPRDMITKVAPVAYDEKADAPQFRKFMRRILNGDAELFRYLQTVFGYALTGSTREQVFFYVRGPKNNGKSTLLNLIRDMLGDYGLHTATETLLVKTHDNNIPNDVARLKGARMVTAIESTPGRQLDESRLKAMTGGDPITARFMRAEWFSFTPQFKLFFAANDDPRVRSTDDALWRRICVLPFEVVIPDDEVDPELPEKLRAEWPGILAWAVRGCLKWQRDGRLRHPDVVLAATASYRKRADHIQKFMRESIIEEEDAETAASVVYRAYTDWCSINYERPLSTARFKRQLEDLGFEHARVKTGSVWRPIRLRR